MHPNYLGVISSEYYLVSCVGGPVQIFHKNSSLHKKLDTGNMACQAHAVSEELLCLGCEKGVYLYQAQSLFLLNVVLIDNFVNSVAIIKD